MTGLATLLAGDPERRPAAAVFAVRFVLTTAIAVGSAVALLGFAAVTPAAVTAIFLQLGRPLPAPWGRRLGTGAALALLLGGAAALGVVLNGPVAAVSAIALAFGLALAARASTVAAIARDPVLILFIFLGNMPLTGAGPLPALLGAALSALIVVVITGLLERQSVGDAGNVVAAALEGVAEALERGGGPTPAADALRADVGTLATPLGSGGRGQALAGLMASVERQQLLLNRIERDWPGAGPDLGDLANQDRDCAAALSGEAPPPEEDDTLKRVRERLESTPDQVVELVSRVDEDDPLGQADAKLLLLDLELTVANTVGLTRQALGLSTPLRDRLIREAPAPAIPRSRVQIAASRVRALISLRSTAMRDAIRLAAAAAIAVAAIELLPFQHGYWVVMTAVIGLRASSHATIQIGRYQALGGLTGFGLALIPIALDAGTAISAAIALLGLLLYAFAQRAGATILGPAALTIVFVMALGQLSGSGLLIGTERILDVGVGIVIAVVAAAFIWPGGREQLTAQALSESFQTAAELIRVTGAWLIHRRSGDETAQAWQAALAAGARAEEALTALAAAPIDGKADYANAIRLAAIATRVRFHAGAALRNTEHVAPGETGMAELLDAEVNRVTQRFVGIATALKATDQVVTPGSDAEAVRTAFTERAKSLGADSGARAQFAYAVLVWHWLRDVDLEAGAGEALAQALGPVGSA